MYACAIGLVFYSVTYTPEPVDVPADGNVLISCAQPADIVLDP